MLNSDVRLLKSSVAMPLLTLPVNSVALRTSRGVVLISPGKNILSFQNDLENFGRVTDIVAPNLFHHMSLHLALKMFPQATLWGVEGFQKKRSDLKWDKTLSETSWNYSDEIEVIDVQGAPIASETVFFHKASKTLVVTDLFFNLVQAKGLRSFIFLKFFGTYRRFAISKLFMKLATDQNAFKESLKKIATLPFESIVMSHGEPVTTQAREAFERALAERGLK